MHNLGTIKVKDISKGGSHLSEFFIANIWDLAQIIYALRLWRKISTWRYSRLWSNTPTVGICLCKKWTVFCKCLSLSLLPPSVAIQRPKRPRRMPHLNFRWVRVCWEELCFTILFWNLGNNLESDAQIPMPDGSTVLTVQETPQATTWQNISRHIHSVVTDLPDDFMEEL